MSNIGTRQKLLSLVDDIEILVKELLENIAAPKSQKLPASEQIMLAELLVMKDQELKNTLKLADEQAEIQKKIDALQAKSDELDMYIQQLQKCLKEAEHNLATAVYQARQKLQSIAKANEKSVSTEELIKYAHRISASNAVTAPHNWLPGDNRRPYPTDIEMRLGFLGRMSDSGSMAQPQQGKLSDLAARAQHNNPNNSSQAGTFTWQSSNDMKSCLSASSSHGLPMEPKSSSKDNEDVEVMSTDSSSSSSSDSQ